jgi:hypothetical protein
MTAEQTGTSRMQYRIIISLAHSLQMLFVSQRLDDERETLLHGRPH